MNDNLIALNEIPVGAFARVKQLLSQGGARRRLLDLGLIRDTIVESLRKSPAGDPIAYQIRGAVIALRAEEACNILVEIV